MPVNQNISLDGVWDFHHDPADLREVPADQAWSDQVRRAAVVPLPWQAQFPDLRLSSGTAWYRRRFVVEPANLEGYDQPAAVLHFGAVNYHATVWLNGECVGEHEGGYLPFEFNVISWLREGENELLVRVIDPTEDRNRYPSYPFSEVPHGKQSWYGPIGGIWQSVSLEFRPRLHITGLALNPQPEEGTISIEVEVSQVPRGEYQIACTVIGPDGETAASSLFDQTLSGFVQLDDAPQLWSPDTPHLYTVMAELRQPGNPHHAVQKVCGFRTIEARDGRLFLNGRPLYLRGVLDQAYYPETIYTPPSLELLETQARLAKELGFNCLRTHIKIEDPRYYDVADRLGLLIWTEIPNWALLTETAAERAKETFRGMIKRDGHHPAIIAWTLVNENWGTDLTRNEEHRRWLADFYREAKAIDPTRLVVDNSACCDNAHVAGDLEDFHHYRVIPDHAAEWDEWVADFAGRAAWAWYADFTENRRADLPLLVSEFGNWGLPDPATIQEQGQEPWWFETGHEWGEGIVYPHGVEQRYEACGLADLFPSYAEFARQSQAHMARSLQYEITTMRLHEAIAGYVITEFTDVHWECNGLLTMQREPKHLLDPLLKDVNQNQVVLLRPQQWNCRPGQPVEILVQTMGISGQEREGVIQWQAGGAAGELAAPGGTISFVPETPGVVTLSARWLAENGSILATNQVEITCVAPPSVSTRLCVVDDAALNETLRVLGYAVSDGTQTNESADDEIIIARRYTQELATTVQQGGRLLLLAGTGEDSRAADIPLPAGYVIRREGTLWQGDWANSFAWVKKQGPLAHLPGAPLLDMAWAAVMPDAVIGGLPSWVQRDHSWAGLAVGWVHRAVSLLTVLGYGRGRVLITTFKLNQDTLAKDAIAQALFAGMINLL